MSDTNLIRTVGLVHIKHCQLLLVRPDGKRAFYLPGGKPEANEDGLAALRREIDEELGTGIVPGTIEHYGTFEEQAYGFDAATKVRIECYTAELTDAPAPNAEIAELRYFHGAEYLAMADTAPAVRMIVDDLRDHGLIV